MKHLKSGIFLILMITSVNGCLNLFFDWDHKDLNLGIMNNKDTVCVFENGDALIGGYYTDYNDYKNPKRNKEKALIYRYSSTEGTASLVYENQGFINKVACKGKVAYGVRSNPKKGGKESHFFILKSIDAGKTWQQKAETAESISTQILILNEKEAWFIGPSRLVHTVDGGNSLHPVLKLNDRTGTYEKIGYDHGLIYVTGKRLRYTDDNGITWKEINSRATVYYETENGYVLAKIDSNVTIGKIVNDQIDWIHSFEGSFTPYRMVVVDDTIRFLASPILELEKRKLGILDIGDGSLLFESDDAGEGWSKSTLNSYAGRWTTDIAGKAAGFSLAPFGGASTPD